MSYVSSWLKHALRSNSNYMECEDHGLARRLTKEIVETLADEGVCERLCEQSRSFDVLVGQPKRDMNVSYACMYDMAEYETKIKIIEFLLNWHILEVSDDAADCFLSLVPSNPDNFDDLKEMNREARQTIEIILENIDSKVYAMEKKLGHTIDDKPSVWFAEDMFLFMDMLAIGWAAAGLNKGLKLDKTVETYTDQFHDKFEQEWGFGPKTGTFRKRLNQELAKIVVADIKLCMLRRSF